MKDDVTESLQLSRSEIESVCRNAARGAGMSWGLAEEAGFAAGWMASRGLDGAELLAMHLHSKQETCWTDVRPVVIPGSWRAEAIDKALCPISLGATLSDYLCVDHTIFNGTGLRVFKVSFPGLLLPFIALVANELHTSICLQFELGLVGISADGSLSGAVSTLMAVDQDTLVIAIAKREIENSPYSDETTTNMTFKGAGETQTINTTHKDVEIPVDEFPQTLISTWPFLYALSMRTTVPASEASRSNAGAVGGDND